jgi:UDP-GlcNAc:undecaprenyl-phosphate/decaprenyl-phosphate GlcNAc-1-phosphate transferase
VNTYLALFLISTFASLTLTPAVRRLCQRFNLLDVPLDGRRVHSRAIPRLGGVAIYLACVIALSTLPFVDNLLTRELRQYGPDSLLLLIPASLVLLLGVYDDLRGANAAVKFGVLGSIATLFFVLGGRIVGVSIPFVGSVHLPLALSYLVTVLWLVGIANAFNLIDGMDGLAAGASLFASLVILVFSFAQGRPLMIVVSLVLCGSLAGFLRYNFNPASIFLGDSGALFIGFTLAALSVLGAQKATTAVAVVIPVLAFGLPVVDTTVTMARRLIGRRPVFQGDNEHIHHMLLARGWSQRQVALVLYGVCAAFGLLAMLFVNTGTGMTGLLLFVLTVVVIIAVGHLRYHEVDEIRAGMKRTVADRRVRVANNIQVRRAARALSKVSNVHQLFDAVGVMLEFGEFDYASALIGRAGDAELNERALKVSGRGGPTSELRGGRIFWEWRRHGVDASDVDNSTAFWCLRLRLGDDNDDLGSINFYRAFAEDPFRVDPNYLVGLFRNELTRAALRVLTSEASRAGVPGLVMHANSGKITS